MEPVPKNFNFNWLAQQLNYLNELSEDSEQHDNWRDHI